MEETLTIDYLGAAYESLLPEYGCKFTPRLGYYKLNEVYNREEGPFIFPFANADWQPSCNPASQSLPVEIELLSLFEFCQYEGIDAPVIENGTIISIRSTISWAPKPKAEVGIVIVNWAVEAIS